MTENSTKRTFRDRVRAFFYGDPPVPSPPPPPKPPLPYADERWCKTGMTYSDVIRETETKVIELQHTVAALEERIAAMEAMFPPMPAFEWIDGEEPELDEEPGANWHRDDAGYYN